MAKIWGPEQNFENLLLQIFLDPFLAHFPKVSGPYLKKPRGSAKNPRKKVMTLFICLFNLQELAASVC